MLRRFITFLFFVVCASCALANPVATENTQTTQLLDSITQAENQLSQLITEHVYLGTSEMKMQKLNSQLAEQKKQLAAILGELHNTQSLKRTLTLQWSRESIATTTNKKTFFNAGTATQPVYICRAPFVGARMSYENAIYPGELIKTGCRISYAGFAFSVSTFHVLAGKQNAARWITLANVKNAMQPPHKNQPAHVTQNSTDTVYELPQLQQLSLNNFNFNIKINGYMPVSGGYQGANPVLICRAQKNNVFVIGKLVFFDNTFGCDIGVASKEVTVMHRYDILFA